MNRAKGTVTKAERHGKRVIEHLFLSYTSSLRRYQSVLYCMQDLRDGNTTVLVASVTAFILGSHDNVTVLRILYGQ